MKRKIICFLLLASCFLFLASCYAEYAGEILDLEIGGRAVGLAGAYTSLSDRAFANWWNPAGIVENGNASAGMTRGSEFGLFNFNCIGVGGAKKDLKIGILPGYMIDNISTSLTFGTMGLDSIPQLPDTLVSQPVGYFGANEQVTIFTIASSMTSNSNSTEGGYTSEGKESKEKIGVGVNIKYLQYNIYNTQASGIGIDVGANYKYKDLSIGAVVKDVGGTDIKWQTNKQDKRQTSIILGTAYRMMNSILMAIDLGYQYNKPIYKFGIEYTAWNLLALRMGAGKGIAFGIGAKPPIPEKWTYGKLKNLNIDYAFSVKELGATSNISLSFIF